MEDQNRNTNGNRNNGLNELPTSGTRQGYKVGSRAKETSSKQLLGSKQLRKENSMVTKKEKKEPPKNNQCKVITWQHWVRQTDLIPEEKISEINPEDFDLFIDRVHMRTIVHSTNGKQHTFVGPIKGVEGKPLGLLMKLLKKPGKFSSPYEIGYTGDYDDSYFIKDNVLQYARKLNKYLFKKKKGHKSRFLPSSRRPYKLAFNGELNFCLIEPDVDSGTDPFV
jgi:hypothetical protein